ncbi:MAG TPA: hypothetical protein VM243_18485 [Phycisphaerae bacterium]|nr:hypothetical protein [Phycisphaerae bacterium]
MRADRLTLVVVALLATPLIARGDVINGDFEDDLNGWSIESGSFGALPDYTGNHWAVSSTGGRLRQTFDLPPAALTLSFRYLYNQYGTGGGAPPDFLNFYFMDPDTLENLIPPPEGLEDWIVFLGQDNTGLYAVNTDYVTVTDPDADGGRYVTIALTHLPPQQSARLEFGSFEFDDGQDSLLAVDDVLVTVPEPASAILLTLCTWPVCRRQRPR